MPLSGALTVDDVQLGASTVWARPLDERDAAFAALRDRCPIAFHRELEVLEGASAPHFCLGANLARQEITMMFQEIFQWLPDLEITSEPGRLLSPFINGIKRMDCTCTPTTVPEL